ncbi:MAG: sulfotransferase [Phormidium sp. GEM2.Bin31]|nr:MAG: sulfotransferase [Phormidium sp. GEM2.Bin31]
MHYIFIGGAPRTGTTLLNSLLCQEATTNPLMAEASYLAYVISTYHRGKRVWRVEGGAYFDDLQDYANFSRPWVMAFLEKTAQRYPQAQHLVLKSPELTKYFPDLFELVPQAQFLILLRDPCDAIASLIEVGDTLKQTRQSPTLVKLLQRGDTKGLAEFFCSYYHPCHSFDQPRFWQQTRYVRYEGVVHYPRVALRQLEGFTGLCLSQTNPHQPWRSDLDFAQLPERYRPWWSTPLYGHGVSSTRVGRYRQVLSPEQVSLIRQVCQPLGLWNDESVGL